MGFCCGAGMVGGMGTIQYESVKVHHVPLQFCPVCHRMEVHPSVEREFELLLEFAQEDGARELNLGTDIMAARNPAIMKAGGPVVFTDRDAATVR